MERRFITTRISEERYFYNASRDVEEPVFVKTILTTLAKRAEEKVFADSHRQYNHQQLREPYSRSTFLEQQERFAPKVNDQGGQTDGAADRRLACVYTRQVPPMKTHVVAPIDSNEAAKLFGGIVVTHYGRKYENRY